MGFPPPVRPVALERSMSVAAVTEYIHANFPRSFYRDANGSGFAGMDLPFPYTSPCVRGEGKFSFFFYWDTYFTNLGLLRTGHAEMARNNIRNMAWFIARQGFMPNHTALFNRSQPPYLALMVREYVEATGDRALLAEVADRLRQEYHFWSTARLKPNGLQGYGSQETDDGCADFHRVVVRRLGVPADVPRAEKVRIGRRYLAEAETGWDFTPRFDGRCDDFAAVDANALLHAYETLFAAEAPALGWDDAALWAQRAERRRALVQRDLWDDARGWFFDYDCANARPGPVPVLAGMAALFAGLATPEQARRAAQALPQFERAHGVAVTPEHDGCRRYQWAFPNVWPPLVYLTVMGLARYGLHDDARRVARKFVDTQVALFGSTGRLWEKTDCETGEVAGAEYGAAAMLGWTAGVFLALVAYLG